MKLIECQNKACDFYSPSWIHNCCKLTIGNYKECPIYKESWDDQEETRHKPYYEYPDGCPAKMKPVFDCSEYHKLNQDKDAICPYCSKPINDNF